MNVLLAEANVPYEVLKEMDEVNPELSTTDVALVVGANDVVNPAAKTTPGAPIYGMPILEVDQAAQVVFLKRSMRPGFAGHRQRPAVRPQDDPAVRRRQGLADQGRRRRQGPLARGRPPAVAGSLVTHLLGLKGPRKLSTDPDRAAHGHRGPVRLADALDAPVGRPGGGRGPDGRVHPSPGRGRWLVARQASRRRAAGHWKLVAGDGLAGAEPRGRRVAARVRRAPDLARRGHQPPGRRRPCTGFPVLAHLRHGDRARTREALHARGLRAHRTRCPRRRSGSSAVCRRRPSSAPQPTSWPRCAGTRPVPCGPGSPPGSGDRGPSGDGRGRATASPGDAAARAAAGRQPRGIAQRGRRPVPRTDWHEAAIAGWRANARCGSTAGCSLVDALFDGSATW